MIFQGTFPEVFALFLIVTTKEKDEITLQFRIVIVVLHHHQGQFISMEVNPSDFGPGEKGENPVKPSRWTFDVHLPDEQTYFNVILEDENAGRC